MRQIFYILAFISTALFIYSIIHLPKQFKARALPSIGEIKGFEDTNRNDDYSKIVEKFRQKIQAINEKANHDQNWYFWLSFVVTALTAASTLVSSIQAAKKDQSNPGNAKTFAVLIAILTFCSTLSNFAGTHFNELKTEETKKAADLTTMRNQFYTDYDKANADTKASVIASYARRLD